MVQTEQQPDLTVQSRTARDIYYDELQKKIQKDFTSEGDVVPISQHHIARLFHAFRELELIDFSPPNSSISAIIIKYIAQYYTPIISEKGSSDAKCVKTQFDIITDAIEDNIHKGVRDSEFVHITIPANYQINVCGFDIHRLNHKWDRSTYIYSIARKLLTLFSSGQYSFMNELTGTYIGQIPGFHSFYTHKIHASPTRVIVSMDKASLDMMINTILTMHYFYNITQASIYEIAASMIKPIEHGKYTAADLLFSHDQVIRLIATLYRGKFTVFGRIALASELILADLFVVYLLVRIFGERDERCSTLLDQIRESNRITDLIRSQRSTRDRRFLELSVRRAIALEKFGVTSSLTAEQTKLIDIEFKKYMSITESPHSKLAGNLQHAIVSRSPQIGKLINEIEKLRKKEIADTFITDQSGNIIICSHILSLANKRQRNESDSNIREEILRQFALPMIDSGYYCKICGELLADADNEGLTISEDVIIRADADPLNSLIYREAAIIISDYIRFKMIPNIRSIIMTIIGTIHDELHSIEIKLSRIKTYSQADIDDMVALYSTIYIFAFFINLVANSADKITFVSTKWEDNPSEPSHIKQNRAEKTSGGASHKVDIVLVQKLFRISVLLISKHKAYVFNKVPGVTPDLIKPTLMTALKFITSINQDVTVVQKYSPEYAFTQTQLYTYLWHMHILAGHEIDKSDIKAIFGRTFTEIITEKRHVYATLISAMPYEVKSDSVQTPTLSLYRQLSYEQFLEYLREQIYTKDIYPKSDILAEFERKYDKIGLFEQRLADLMATSRVLSRVFLEAAVDFEKLNRADNIELVKYYCPDGRQHKFDIYIVEAASKLIEFRPKDMMTADGKKLKSIELINAVFRDARCSLCSLRLSDMSGDVSVQVQERTELISFYQLYLDKCPIGDLHTMVVPADIQSQTSTITSQCSKCGFIMSYYMNKDRKYYEKYVNVFRELRKSKKSIAITQFLQTIGKIRDRKIYEKEFGEWTMTNTNILELSKVTGITYNILINIGLNEGKKFELIEQEKENRYATMTDIDAQNRIQYLESYALFVIRCCSALRNYERVDIPPELKMVDRKSLGELDIPDVHDDFMLKYEYYKDTLDKKLLGNFLLDFICKTILSVIASGSALPHAIAEKRHKIGIIIINSILDKEKNIIEPDMAKIKIGESSTEDDVIESLMTEETDGSATSHGSKSDELDLGIGDLDISSEAMDNIVDND